MKKTIALAVAFAAALPSFAANAMDLPAAAGAMLMAVERTASSVDAMQGAAFLAQDGIGFPALPDFDVAPSRQKSGALYHAIIIRHAAANGVPLNLARAVISVESNFRANARGGAGEVGLMQIKPATARSIGFRGSTKALYDPETNIRFGMMYLGMARKLGDGSTCGTILKYNAGHAAKRMNPVSRAYCGKVKRLLAS